MSVDKTEICQICTIQSQDTGNAVTKICQGNIGVLGKLWIYTLRSFLVGSTLCPIASCACKIKPSPPEITTKKLKLSELSVYDCPTLLEQKPCEVRPIFNYLKPYVRQVRKSCQDLIGVAGKELSSTVDEVTNDFYKAGDSIKKYFRDDENLTTRQRLLYAGGVLGYLKPGGLLKRLFSSTCLLTATGLLCFPKETDQVIRSVSYQTGQATVCGYYFMTGKKPPDD